MGTVFSARSGVGAHLKSFIGGTFHVAGWRVTEVATRNQERVTHQL